jgi:hypothetical protein
MSEPPQTNIAVNFNNIHNIITRGLKVSIEGVQAVMEHGFQDESHREGLFNYIRALSSILNSHHLTEDEIAFPYFRELLPEAPFDKLMYWHQEMVKMLDEIKLALEKCAKNDQLEMNLGNLLEELTRLYDTWRPHIQSEAVEFISKADALVSVEEQIRLVGQFSEYGVKTALPHPLTVPFLLYNLPPEDRLVFSKDMPAEIVQHLVPVVWKDQWASMLPFFLA